MADFSGGIGDDTQGGTADDDSFDFSQGGHDTLYGGDGDDSFYMGASLDSLDVIDGGDQLTFDNVEIGGDYSAGLTITSSMFVGIEGLSLDAGVYRLALGDGVAPSGGQFPIAAFTGASGSFDASALTDAGIYLAINDGAILRVTGGDSDDWIAQHSVDRHNVLIGGSGSDTIEIGMDSNFHLAGHSFQGFETLRVEGQGAVFLADGNVAAGDTLSVVGFSTAAVVDGHKETDGHFAMTADVSADRLTGGHLSDTIDGGGGDDTLAGGLGGDQLTGGGGADTFVYLNARDSWKGGVDLITDLQAGDAIDLSHIDADKLTAGNQSFTQVEAFTGQAGQLVLNYDADSNTTHLMADVDGDGRADFQLDMSGNQTGFAGLVL